MIDASEEQAAETASDVPVAEPEPPADVEQPKDDDRLGHARTALVHGVESVVDKVAGAVSSIAGRK